jgi:hypothetical protein
MKKVTVSLIGVGAAVVLISIGTAAGLMAASWSFGLHQRMLNEAYAVSTADKHVTEMIVTFSLLRQLDSGQIADAQHMLKMRLDAEILAVEELLEYVDADTQKMARKMFATIAEHRAAHPSSYTGSLAQPSAEVDAAVAAILQEAVREQAK